MNAPRADGFPPPVLPQAARRRVPSRAATVLLTGLLVTLAALSVSFLVRTLGSGGALAPDFTLVDQDARPLALSTLRGHPVVLFFGYAHCPDVCPTTLARLAQALRSPGAPRDTRVAFVTVDPERDSPAVLKRYVHLFDPEFIGLSGSPQALDGVYAAYHVLHQTRPAEHDRGEYSVSHGTTLYYVGRDGRLNGLGNWDDATLQIAHDIKQFQ